MYFKNLGHSKATFAKTIFKTMYDEYKEQYTPELPKQPSSLTSTPSSSFSSSLAGLDGYETLYVPEV